MPTGKRYHVSSQDITQEARKAISVVLPHIKGNKYGKDDWGFASLADGTPIQLLSQEAAKYDSHSLEKKGYRFARLQAQCACGKWFSTGTFNQHRAACEKVQLDKSIKAPQLTEIGGDSINALRDAVFNIEQALGTTHPAKEEPAPFEDLSDSYMNNSFMRVLDFVGEVFDLVDLIKSKLRNHFPFNRF